MKLKSIVSIGKTLRFNNLLRFLDKVLRWLLKDVKLIIFKLVSRKYNLKESIVVFSEARGGSTWVMEVLTESFNAVNIFEPLWGREGEFKKIAGMYSSPFYFGKDDKVTKRTLYNFLKDTMVGENSCSRTVQFNSFRKIFTSKRLVIKLVNVNLIAKWFVETFPLNNHPIYVIRHPLTILASRLKYGVVYGETYENVKVEEFDMTRLKSDDHPYLKHIDFLNSCNTKYSRYLCEWCIRNFPVIENNGDGLTVVLYEDLVLKPKVVERNLSKKLKMDISFNMIFNQSGTTSLNDSVLKSSEQINKWLDTFSEEDKDEFQLIFDYFNINLYTAFVGLPQYEMETDMK